jgi:hypothetical protein
MRLRAEEDLNIPLICRTPLAELQLRFSEDPMYRWKNWKLLESAGCSSEIRLLHIDTVLLDAVSENWYWTPDFFDAAVDLFDFLRYVATGSFSPHCLMYYSYSPVPESRQSATEHLVHCISATRDSWEPLSVILDFLSRFATAGDVPMYVSPTSSSIDFYFFLEALGTGQHLLRILNPTRRRSWTNAIPSCAHFYVTRTCSLMRVMPICGFETRGEACPMRLRFVLPGTATAFSAFRESAGVPSSSAHALH